jgi:hypothetical protein
LKTSEVVLALAMAKTLHADIGICQARFFYPSPLPVVISTEAGRPHRPAQWGGPALVVAVAFAVASEIGSGFSPDILSPNAPGFSPWDRPFPLLALAVALPLHVF